MGLESEVECISERGVFFCIRSWGMKTSAFYLCASQRFSQNSPSMLWNNHVAQSGHKRCFNMANLNMRPGQLWSPDPSSTHWECWPWSNSKEYFIHEITFAFRGLGFSLQTRIVFNSLWHLGYPWSHCHTPAYMNSLCGTGWQSREAFNSLCGPGLKCAQLDALDDLEPTPNLHLCKGYNIFCHKRYFIKLNNVMQDDFHTR
jgi:hypothetical protein